MEEEKKVLNENVEQEESEQAKAVRKQLEELNKPVEITDKDLKFAPRELDVRQLTNKGWRQMVQKHLVVMGARLQNIDSSLIDLQRLCMLILTKEYNMSIDEILTELDNMDDKILEKVKKLQKLN